MEKKENKKIKKRSSKPKKYHCDYHNRNFNLRLYWYHKSLINIIKLILFLLFLFFNEIFLTVNEQIRFFLFLLTHYICENLL
jgi:hypothetical protein